MAVASSGVDSEPAFKFLDRFSSPRYGCDVCQTVPARALRAQCCGALYCQPCAELIQSSAAIAGEGGNKGSLVTWNPASTTCTKCQGTDLCLVPDPKIQGSIDRLQVECTKPGCGWMGDFSAIESHLQQPHDNPEDIYDNDYPAEEPADYEEEYFGNSGQQDGGGDIYDDATPLQQEEDSEEQIYDNEAPAQEEDEQIYDNEAPAQEDDQIYDNEAPAEAPVDDTEGIYDEAPDPNDIGEQIYDNEAPEVDRLSFTTEPPTKPQPSTSSHPPPLSPSDYREVVAETSNQQQTEPGKTEQQQMMQLEEGSLTSARKENLCLRFYRSAHGRDFADLTTTERLFYVMGFLAGSLWLLFVPPVVVLSVMSGLRGLSSGDASFAPSCGDYSIALLLVVLVAHVVMAVFLLLWYCRGSCKGCRGKRMNRATLSSLCLLTLIYAIIVVGFSVSVLAFVNQSRDVTVNETSNSSMVMSGGGMVSEMGGGSGSGAECEGEMGSGMGDLGSGNMTTCKNSTSEPQEKAKCIKLLSDTFILVAVFFGMLVIFVSAILCLFCYECSHNGCCYRREFYDPTVIVFENETTFNSD